MPTQLVHAKNAIFKVGTAGAPTALTDISAWLEDVAYPKDLDTPETTTFGQGAHTMITGFPTNIFNLKGKWDPTIWAILGGLFGLPNSVACEFDPAGVDAVIHTPKYTFAGNTSGNAVAGVYLTALHRDTGVKAVVTFTATFTGQLNSTRGTN